MLPIIFGIRGTDLLKDEAIFFEKTQPFGFILFERNCKTPKQVRGLIKNLKNCLNHNSVPVLIDQEGGKVVRLQPPHWRRVLSASLFGKIAQENLVQAKQAVFNQSYLVGNELKELGVNVNCAPCADVFNSEADSVIGSRSFSNNKNIVTALCIESILGFFSAGVLPVIKHLPGHGRAPSDSHHKLPVINESQKILEQEDFYVFKEICHFINKNNYPNPWGMTAHIKYSKIDQHFPATQSFKIIQDIIRGYIDFKGPLITDCLTMKALYGSIGQRGKDSLSAGCHILLHCSGNLDDMKDLVKGMPEINKTAWEFLKGNFTKIEEMHHPNLDTKIMSNMLAEQFKSLLDA